VTVVLLSLVTVGKGRLAQDAPFASVRCDAALFAAGIAAHAGKWRQCADLYLQAYMIADSGLPSTTLGQHTRLCYGRTTSSRPRAILKYSSAWQMTSRFRDLTVRERT